MPLSSSSDSTEAEASEAPTEAMTEAALLEAALDYLARYAASTTRLRRVLERRVRRRSADRNVLEAARKTIAEVIAKLTAKGLLEDGRYASTRAESLTRQGRSRRWIEAKLSADGVASPLIRDAIEALPGSRARSELGAAIAFAKRRRLGPYRTPKRRSREELKALASKELAALARAGFDHRTARIVLDAGSAETLLAMLDEA
jgi:regulatory protein